MLVFCTGLLRLDFLLNIFLVKFELTVRFKHKMIAVWQNKLAKKFECGLAMFELTMPYL